MYNSLELALLSTIHAYSHDFDEAYSMAVDLDGFDEDLFNELWNETMESLQNEAEFNSYQD